MLYDFRWTKIKTINNKKYRFCEDYYISSFGDVYYHKKDGTRRFLKPNKTRDGYMLMGLRYKENGKTVRRCISLHRLVYEAFGDDISDMELYEIDHLDNRRDNNYIDNLEKVTKLENLKRRKERGGYAKGSDAPGAVLSDKQVHEICKLLEKGDMSNGKIAKLYNVGKSTIRYITNSVSWTHISCNYNISPVTDRVCIGEDVGSAKLTETDVYNICDILLQGNMSDIKIGKMFNVSDATIYDIRKYRTWKHITSSYKFPLKIKITKKK